MPKIELSISDIFEYVGDRMRPLKEGEAVFKAGHIIMCGVDVEQTHIVKSLCLQTAALTQPPHEIQIIPMENEPWKCKCSCKAGMSGFCKHIIGTLIYINRNEDLEYLSCTDLTQKWGKEKKGMEDLYRPKPFREFCHPSIKRRKVDLKTNEALDRKKFNILSVASGNSSLATFLGRTLNSPSGNKKTENSARKKSNIYSPSSSKDTSVATENQHFQMEDRPSLTEHMEKILKNVEESQFIEEISGTMNLNLSELLPCCKVVLESLKDSDIMKVAIEYKQGSDMWKKERQLRITGSNCYSIYTYKKESWENKSISFFFPKGFSNKFVQHGIKFESEAIKLFKTKNANYDIVQPNMIISKCFPWLGFSPDGIIFQEGKPWRLIEVKCPYIGKEHESEKFVELCDFLTYGGSGSEAQLKNKHPYYGQVQLGMALLNLRETHFIVYSSFSCSYLELIIKFDEIFAKALIETITRKYFDNMLHYYCLNK